MEKFVAGILVGGMVGALAVANSRKMHALVKKSQEEVLTKIDETMEKKLEEMESKDSAGSESKPKKQPAKKAKA